MRYPASEKLEIIRTVEGSHLPVKQTLDMLCIPRSTFYRWYDLYVDGGVDALADHSPRPGSVWNRIPDARRDDLIEFALEHEALSTRELAVKYTDEKKYFISESSAYRILKAADLITAPDYVVIKAADEFKDKTTRNCVATTIVNAADSPKRGTVKPIDPAITSPRIPAESAYHGTCTKFFSDPPCRSRSIIAATKTPLA